MTDAAMLVDLLRVELEKLKESDPTLDWAMLDQLHAAVAADIRMDELFGPRINEPHQDMHALLDEAATMSREVQAFMAAGIRAYRSLETRLPAA